MTISTGHQNKIDAIVQSFSTPEKAKLDKVGGFFGWCSAFLIKVTSGNSVVENIYKKLIQDKPDIDANTLRWFSSKQLSELANQLNKMSTDQAGKAAVIFAEAIYLANTRGHSLGKQEALFTPYEAIQEKIPPKQRITETASRGIYQPPAEQPLTSPSAVQQPPVPPQPSIEPLPTPPAPIATEGPPQPSPKPEPTTAASLSPVEEPAVTAAPSPSLAFTEIPQAAASATPIMRTSLQEAPPPIPQPLAAAPPQVNAPPPPAPSPPKGKAPPPPPPPPPPGGIIPQKRIEPTTGSAGGLPPPASTEVQKPASPPAARIGDMAGIMAKAQDMQRRREAKQQGVGKEVPHPEQPVVASPETTEGVDQSKKVLQIPLRPLTKSFTENLRKEVISFLTTPDKTTAQTSIQEYDEKVAKHNAPIEEQIALIKENLKTKLIPTERTKFQLQLEELKKQLRKPLFESLAEMREKIMTRIRTEENQILPLSVLGLFNLDTQAIDFLKDAVRQAATTATVKPKDVDEATWATTIETSLKSGYRDAKEEPLNWVYDRGHPNMQSFIQKEFLLLEPSALKKLLGGRESIVAKEAAPEKPKAPVREVKLTEQEQTVINTINAIQANPERIIKDNKEALSKLSKEAMSKIRGDLQIMVAVQLVQFKQEQKE